MVLAARDNRIVRASRRRGMARRKLREDEDASRTPMGRLAQYWFRARLMHDLLHWMLEEHDRDINAIYDSGEGWDFETFMAYWLSGLFVVVEGFNKLKLKDARVQRSLTAI